MMLSIRKMNETDLTEMYHIALRAFKEDYDLYGQYPPLLNLKQERLNPSADAGYVFLYGEQPIGGSFAWQSFDRATLGAIFIAPEYQGRGFGQQFMGMIEQQFPNARTWTLDTPYKAYRNHHFYEKLGYQKVREHQPDKNNAFKVIIYKKTV